MKLQEMWWDKTYPIRKLISSISNLRKWFPIVWKDRDYDSHFIFEALAFKLNKVAKHTEQNKSHLHWEVEVQRMRTAIKLIKLLQDDYYEMECMDYYDSSYNFVETGEFDENGDPYYTMESEVYNDRLDDYFTKYPLVYKQVVKEYEVTNIKDCDRQHLSIRMARKNHQRAKRLLFNILNNHIENWWD